jgi:hypothetical protein
MALTPEEELELLELEEEEYQAQKSKAQDVAPKKDVSMLDSAARGYAQGATLGFADEIGGMIGAGIDKVAGLFGDSPTEVNKKLAEQGFKGDIGPTDFKGTYRQSRNEQRIDDAKAQEANPWTYGGANLAGSFVPGSLPLAQIGKGASALRAGAVGAGMGAAQGAGNTEEIASVKALEDILTGAAFGGASGAALQGVANKFGKVDSENVQKSLKDIANSQAARALGAERGTIKKLGADQVDEIGRYALDNKLLTPFSNVDDVITRNEAVKNKAGQTMGNVFSQIDEAGASTFNPNVAAKRMENDLGGFWRDPINKGEANQFDNILESIKNRGGSDISLQDAQLLKEKIGKTANWKNNLVVTDKEKMAREAYDIVNKYIDESADVASDLMGTQGLKETLKGAKKTYSGAKGAESLLENKQAREQGNKMFGLTDSIIGGAGLATSPFTGGMSAIPAMALVGGKKLLEKYGSQTAAIGFDKLGDYVRKNPNMFGKFSDVLSKAAQRGSNALGATHFMLQQTNPEYREQLKALEEE